MVQTNEGPYLDVSVSDKGQFFIYLYSHVHHFGQICRLKLHIVLSEYIAAFDTCCKKVKAI